MNLYKASNQWAQRPADERFSTLPELATAVRHYRDSAVVAPVATKDLRVEATDSDLSLVGRKGIPATLTHFAFGQLSGYASAPASYLRSLPPTLAAQNLNHGMAKHAPEDMQLLFHRNDAMVLRGMNSLGYTRIWNADVVDRLMRLPDGWRVPPARPAHDGQPGSRPATEADVLSNNRGGGGLSINVGDMIAPAGLYASDHDLFVFMVNEDRRISEPGNPDGLSRGFFVWNAEVPGVSFGISTFLYRHVCGNHIVWDASKVSEIRLRHVGTADARAFSRLRMDLRQYADASASETEAQIKRARTIEIAGTKDEVLDRVFGLKSVGLSRSTIEAGYALAERHSDVDGSPRSPWGLAQGLTRHAQTTPYADDRTRIDRAAGKVLSIAF